MEQLALDALDASWAPADEKAGLRTRLLTEFDELRAAEGLAARG